ncbi:MAG: lipoprotein signal peptidase [Bacteroidaceae bacterium]|nr:lipoprotein signal peptidase [Bacteroidaceae bacterium]
MEIDKVTKKRGLLALFIVSAAVVIDQIIKIVVKLSMYLHESFAVCGDWFYIYFTENPGMAFGMEFGSKLFLTLFRVVAVSLLIYYLCQIVRNPKFPIGYIVCIALVLAGATGNIIDCLFYGEIFSDSRGAVATFVPWGEGYGDFLYGKVVDMFHFPLFSFDWPKWMPFVGGENFVFFSPIFNFAYACISCSVLVIALFYYKYVSCSFKNEESES